MQTILRLGGVLAVLYLLFWVANWVLFQAHPGVFAVLCLLYLAYYFGRKSNPKNNANRYDP